MKLGLTKFLLLLTLTWPALLSAYVVNVGVGGEKLLWPSSVSTLTLRVDPTNASGISSFNVAQIVGDSAAAWNQASQKTIQISAGSGTQTNSNDLIFSSDPLWFGGSAGVVGVTQVAYAEQSGAIVEADIILNDTYDFSTSNQDEFYLGNVLTHEMGHFLGLSHSQLPNATMFYRLRRGQHTLFSDDKGAANAIRSSGKGHSISGTVIGGNLKIPVLGSHVSAISLNKGEIVAGTLSDQLGNFTIYGLDASDSYYLYVEPVKNLSSLPSYYKDTKSNFCDSGTDYRGSFFQSCFSSGIGHPQLIQMSGQSQSIGYVTIRCQLDAAPEYLAQKNGVYDFQMDQAPTGKLEATKAFVGFYTEAMLENNTQDLIEINLPDLQSYPELQGRDLFLDVKFLSQNFYSVFHYNMEATGDSLPLSLPTDDRSRFDDYAVPELDVHLQFPLLSVGGSSRHEITMTPQTMSDFLTASFDHVSDYPYMPMTDDYFPAFDNGYQDELGFYLAIASIKERQIDGSFVNVALPQQKTVFDNLQCPDASRTYSVSGSVSKASSASSDLRLREDSKLPLTCGSVDFTGGNGGGGNPPFTMLCLLGCAVLVSLKFREAL